MEEIVRCIDCGYCDVEPWGAWCKKENAELNDVFDEHKCDSFFQHIKKEASYQQLSKALCGKENATLNEMLEAVEQLKYRAEPEMRPLTLEEVRAHCAKGPDAEPLWAEFKEECAISRWIVAVIPPDVFDRPVLSEWIATDRSEKYGKEWRCWPRKPTPEQMRAEKWEE